MLEIALDRYPVRTTLTDGSPCTIRPLEDGDEGIFRDFHLVIPDREQLFVRKRIQDGTLFEEWSKDPSCLPLLAFIDGKLVALGVLEQRRGGWKRHIGKVAFLTHPDYHGKGLLDNLLKEIVHAAEWCGLTRLESELNGERENAIKSLGMFGFEELARVPDYIQDRQAHYHDYVLMGMELVASFEHLGAGD